MGLFWQSIHLFDRMPDLNIIKGMYKCCVNNKFNEHLYSGVSKNNLHLYAQVIETSLYGLLIIFPTLSSVISPTFQT